jgi:HPt (histidine-containing phosphotransfer) domain-containing protein
MAEPDSQKRHSYVTRAELLASFDDDAYFAQEIVAAFLSRCPILLGEIRSGFRDGDAVAVSCAAQALKGSVGYFAHGDVYAAAQRIEQITAAELPRFPTLLLALERELADLTQYLERGLDDEGYPIAAFGIDEWPPVRTTTTFTSARSSP